MKLRTQKHSDGPIVRYRTNKQFCATECYKAVDEALTFSRKCAKRTNLDGLPNQSQTEGVTVSPQQERETPVNSPLKKQ